MKTLRTIFLMTVTALAISLARAEDSEAANQALGELRGEWSMVSGSTDGQPMPEGLRNQMKRVCAGDEVTVTMRTQVYLKAKITLDPQKQPQTIDYQVTGGLNKGKTQLGIYTLEGDTFKSCFSAPGDPRPADFTTQPGDHRTLTVWKRVRIPAEPEKK